MGENEPGHRSYCEHFPLNIGPDRAGDGRFLSNSQWGECIPDGGAWQFQGYDENGLCRSLNGRLIGAHKVLCSAGEVACNGRQDFYLGSEGGFMIPVHRNFGHEMRMYFERQVNWYGRNNSFLPTSRTTSSISI